MRTVHRRSANHGLHLFLTIVTFGLWAPVWLAMAMIGRREVTTVSDTRAVQQAWDYYHLQHLRGNAVPAPVQTHNAHRVQMDHQWNPYTQRWEQTPYGGS